MYRETTQLVVKSEGEKAEATARRVEQFLAETERQISWATRASTTTIEQRRADYRAAAPAGAGDRPGDLSRQHRPGAGAPHAPANSSQAATSTTRAIRVSRSRRASRSGGRRSISTAAIRSWRSRWRIRDATPARPSPRSASNSSPTIIERGQIGSRHRGLHRRPVGPPARALGPEAGARLQLCGAASGRRAAQTAAQTSR